MTESISPHECLRRIDSIFIEVCRESGLLPTRSLKGARKIQARYLKQGEHASIQDILMYEGMLGRSQVDEIHRTYGNQIFGCVECNQIKRFDADTTPTSCPGCEQGHLVRVFRATEAMPEIGSPHVEMKFRPGSKVGDYTIEDILGSGAMGRVYRCTDASGRIVAMKVLYPEDGLTWEDVKRFLHEVASMTELAHEHVMSVTDSGMIDDQYYYCMELVEGETLSHRIDHGLLDRPTAIRIGQQLAVALDHIHGRGVVHRDLKPDNIMFDENDSPRLLDFGIAKNVMQTTQVTEYGTALGTPAYMSPEQARGEIHKVSPSTDIYALGVLMYEMSTGRIPFDEEHDVTRLLDKIESEEPRWPRELDPSISEDLERVIKCAMAKDPRSRYASAGLMAEDLGALARGERPRNLDAPRRSTGVFTRMLRKFRGAPPAGS